MKRIVNKETSVFKLFGIPVFCNDYTTTQVEESDECEEVSAPIRVMRDSYSSKRREQINFLEKLYRRDNNIDNLGDDTF